MEGMDLSVDYMLMNITCCISDAKLQRWRNKKQLALILLPLPPLPSGPGEWDVCSGNHRLVPICISGPKPSQCSLVVITQVLEPMSRELGVSLSVQHVNAMVRGLSALCV